jgi:Flp pilus assembly CpaF family ATPase
MNMTHRNASPTETTTFIRVLDVPEAPLVVDVNAQHRRALASIDTRREARRLLRERLKPEQSGISLHELDEGAPATREKVERMAMDVVSAMQQLGREAKARFIPDDVASDIVKYLLDWQFGVGPLQPLFEAPDVEDIVANTLRDAQGKLQVEVFTYRQSGKRREAIEITSEELLDLVNRNAASQGRMLTPTTPILSARMRNGARLSAALDPICDPFLSVTIRIHRLVARSFDDLVARGTLTVAAASWLWLCVRSGLAIVVGGGTSSGKTNFLNAIARVMDGDLRVVVIEDTRELDLLVPDHVYLTTFEVPDGSRAVSQRHLVAASLRMRPDRLVMGEVRDGAAWDAVKATNTGHEGTLLTIHAEDVDGVLTRLAQLCSEAPETFNLPERTLRQLIASAFQVAVFLERRRQPDGSFRRFVTAINEHNGLVTEGNIQRQPMFAMQNGVLIWTKLWPHERIKRRMADASFNDSDIESALTGRVRLWQEDR